MNEPEEITEKEYTELLFQPINASDKILGKTTHLEEHCEKIRKDLEDAKSALAKIPVLENAIAKIETTLSQNLRSFDSFHEEVKDILNGPKKKVKKGLAGRNKERNMNEPEEITEKEYTELLFQPINASDKILGKTTHLEEHCEKIRKDLEDAKSALAKIPVLENAIAKIETTLSQNLRSFDSFHEEVKDILNGPKKKVKKGLAGRNKVVKKTQRAKGKGDEIFAEQSATGQYTGAHKERFDAEGKGKGASGRVG